MLGASPRRAFWLITLPLLKPILLAAALLVFIFNFTSFGVVLILGGPRFATLEVEIYRQAVNLFNLPVAAALSLIQILFTLLLMVLYSRSQRVLAHPQRLRATRLNQRAVKTGRARLLVGATLGGMLLLLGLPLLALIIGSVSGEDGLTLTFYRELFINRRGSLFFVPPIEAVLNSTRYALATVIAAVGLGLISATLLTRPQPRWQSRWLRWLDPLLMLPLATSAVTLGFGFILTMNKPLLNLRSSPLLVIIAHTLIGLPFVVRALLPALRRINPRWREAAQLLGASPGRVWRLIDWPLSRRAALVGAVFAFTVSMGEFGATLFIARPQTPTLPVAIFRFLSQPGALNFGQALAMSTLLMLVCAAGFMLIERFRVGDEGEF
jgi:thiamine transport system permease protein